MMDRLMLTTFFLIAFLTCFSNGYPHISIEKQDPDDGQMNLPEFENVYSYQQSAAPDNAQFYTDKLQYLLRQPKLSRSWENLYRAPESKRQVRYRQCYFNPISCF